MIQSKTLRLNNGVEMPRLGLGVFRVPPRETERAVRLALEAGYRLIDTAAFYNNEKEVGNAIRASGIPRNEIFVTTKLHPLRCFNVEEEFEESRKRLGWDYIDLYLIHWPFLRKRKVWQSLEKIVASGRARAIGVSNYRVKDLEDLLKSATIVPAVNQVEFHPFLTQKKLREYCASKEIVLEAHSPLAHGTRLNDPSLRSLGERYGKTPAQIMIRWALQHGTVAIPKSVNAERLKENLDVFDFTLSDEDVIKIDELNANDHMAGFSRLLALWGN